MNAISTFDDINRDEILGCLQASRDDELFQRADAVRREYLGETVFVRGILEFSNCCARNCMYCGLRRDHTPLQRYRMTSAEILQAVAGLVEQGIETVILQSGDDLSYTRHVLCKILHNIKRAYPGVAITLSIGERPTDDYRALYDAGADRYLLKHETANPHLYGQLHPGQLFQRRVEILHLLRAIGYQVGVGCIVGLPGQTLDDLTSDILFLKEFQPDMAGLGPFLPQVNTPFSNQPAGDENLTLRMLALARIVTKYAYLPVTTALASLDPLQGLVLGLSAGCNVIMTNGTPDAYCANYRIYDNRQRITLEMARKAIAVAGRMMTLTRGDSLQRQFIPTCNGSKAGYSFHLGPSA